MLSNGIGITASRGTRRGGPVGFSIRERAAALRGRGHVLLRNRAVGGTVVAAATTILLPAVLLAVAPQAHAATSYQGRVTTAALNVRSAPTSAAPDVGTLRNGTTISIQCKVFGPSVGGNTLWYKLSTGRWVTARYVANIGTAPRFCGDGREYEGRAVSFLNVRSGPHTANATVSSAPQGTFLPLVCKVDSQVIDGNSRWYQLTSDGGGQWVAARYVSNVGSAPPSC
ncbi:SH3 domain-containing protein [Actinopolymorpha alba]|uniref:SH3 domain-containing protein n=1 Tax=Actinopolymorpha alba TaxID=533267 RepID=UPI00036C6821|nr:SH3 domain-containing protein [Actinopolymorpha alba]